VSVAVSARGWIFAARVFVVVSIDLRGSCSCKQGLDFDFELNAMSLFQFKF